MLGTLNLSSQTTTGSSSAVPEPVVEHDSTEDSVALTSGTIERTAQQWHDTEEPSNPCGWVVLVLVLSACLLGVLFALFLWCCVVGNGQAEETVSCSDEGEL